MKLQGKIAVVTGGAKGIGMEICKAFASEGAVVIAADMGEMSYQCENVHYAKLNVTDSEGCKLFFEDAIAKFGKIDILVNNAGITKDAMTRKMTDEQWDTVLNVNLKGVFNLTRHIGPQMETNNGGSIINISASSSVGAIPGRPAYQASKGAINSLTRQMAFDYGKQGIRVNTIVVGFTNTGAAVFEQMLGDPQIKAAFEKLVLTPYLGESSDIANGAIYLASDEAKYVTGTMLTIDGGALCHQSQPELDFVAMRARDR